jgi:hypothetical protein
MNSPRNLGPASLPWLLFLLGMIITGLLWRNAQQEALRVLEQDLAYRADGIAAAITHRLQATIQVLRGVEGVFNSSHQVSPPGVPRLRAIPASGGALSRHPGGWATPRAFPPDSCAPTSPASSGKASPATAYAPRESGRITAPSSTWSPSRGATCGPSATTCIPSRYGGTPWSGPWKGARRPLSGRVRLEQETEADVQHGFLLYVPVYAHGHPHATPAQRRAHLQGWAYSPPAHERFHARGP